MQSHLFESEGMLFDTRVDDWAHNPLRPNFSVSHGEINSIADLKATLRNGAYAWPGGYPLYFVTADGAALAFETVRKEYRTIVAAMLANPAAIPSAGDISWCVVGCAVNWEDTDLIDEHTGDLIETAYA